MNETFVPDYILPALFAFSLPCDWHSWGSRGDPCRLDVDPRKNKDMQDELASYLLVQSVDVSIAGGSVCQIYQ